MHVTPTDLRVVRREGGLILRFSVLDSVACVLAEVTGEGSRTTSLEEYCERPHWGIVLRGTLTIERHSQRTRILPGQGFHVPAGAPAHRFVAQSRTVFGGFVALGSQASVIDDAAVEDIVRSSVGAANGSAAPGSNGDAAGAGVELRIGGADSEQPLEEGAIEVTSTPMGRWIYTRARFGPTSGYGSGLCDIPHWGIVLEGSATIDYEDDVEVVGAGDFYACPIGPPGHRLEVADGATIADFTARSSFTPGRRVAEWRSTPETLGSVAEARAEGSSRH
ncbi:MAG: hypothetical protein H0X16_02070 [Chloroflexi bacterium]|nr:hypothetical protein [Chloroflexota bacterium]